MITHLLIGFDHFSYILHVSLFSNFFKRITINLSSPASQKGLQLKSVKNILKPFAEMRFERKLENSCLFAPALPLAPADGTGG